MGYHDARFEVAGSGSAGAFAGAIAQRHFRRAYGGAAVAAAIENGLMPEELSEVLGGRRVVEAFPVDGGESVDDYAHRAVAEMMVAYLSYAAA
ncbi:hypothetical protein [Methylobacterium sp. 77]|uniref:hypothetical protein n=1 Tax=Methylobacterium sp. 77 TaxID=1101192 RepID=UPI00036991D7|nr:hypothetical protein [Methylobacterium sp. 77]